jgi:hypothetical protein
VGALRVSVVTTGVGYDLDGYMFSRGAGLSQLRMAPNDDILVTPLPEGSHDVLLTDVSENCAVDGDYPRRVRVLPNDTVPVHFVVTCRAELLSALILSNPVATRGVADRVVYASLRPGPGLIAVARMLIRTRRTGAAVRAVMTAGGFDPLPVAAAAGDTLDVRAEYSTGQVVDSYFAVVPSRRAPVVVRSNPMPEAAGVPQDVAPLVVFSEPIDAATPPGLVMEMLPSGAPVVGAVAFGDSAHLTATFTPAEPLAEATEHAVRVTQVITDLDGDTLETPVAISFWTHNPADWDDHPPAGLVVPEPVRAPGRAYIPLQPRRSSGERVAIRNRRTGADTGRGGRRLRSTARRGVGR